jgi:hypothetical protein
MNLEDDLRRLFADKAAFDVPVAEDATDTVVSGARRVRKRRRAVASATGALTMAAMVGVAVAIAGNGGAAGAPPVGDSLTVATASSLTSAQKEVVPTAPATSVVTGKMSTPRGNHQHTGTHKAPPPSTDTEPEPPGNPMAFGPSGFDGVSLGMTQADAEATGVITQNRVPDGAPGCTGYDWTGFSRPPSDYVVIISATAGVARITSLTNAVTPEGIYRGVGLNKLRAAYPDGTGDDYEWVAPVPGNPQARYDFVLEDGRVSFMRLDVVGSECLP